MWERELEVAKTLAKQAGNAIMDIYNKDTVNVEYKKDDSPLTLADKESNRIIIEVLKAEFPSYAILSEETEDDRSRLNNDYCFIIDPLDGTKEFLKKNGQFTVNIALSYKHSVVMGVVYVPAKDELYYASQGTGAYRQCKNENAVQIHVSDKTNIDELTVVLSNSHGCEEMDDLLKRYNLQKFLKVGSSLKGCMVACGDAEIYYRYNPTMEWDTAAMQCIAEEAGAAFRQMDDSDMNYNRENSLNDKGFYVINNMKNRLR
jgi:3'(2'), 5'-bisphosphate nucleotidase